MMGVLSSTGTVLTLKVGLPHWHPARARPRRSLCHNHAKDNESTNEDSQRGIMARPETTGSA